MSVISASSPALDPDLLQLVAEDFETTQPIDLATSNLTSTRHTTHQNTVLSRPSAQSSSPSHSPTQRRLATPSRSRNNPLTRAYQTRQGPFWPRSSSPAPANTWATDTVFTESEHIDLAQAVASRATDEQFLNDLAEIEFSSPSSYPPLTGILLEADSTEALLSRRTANNTRQLPPAAEPRTLTESSRSYSGISASTAEESAHSLASTTDLDEGTTTTADTSFSETMAAVTRRTDAEALSQNKRPRLISPRVLQRTRIEPSDEEESLFLNDSDDLFGEDPVLDKPDGAADPSNSFTTIDLTEATEVPDELKRPEVDNRVKLSSFQCVICMDDATTLTLTHCGHLFCAQCLHSSLHADTTKGKCPMCRSKIDMKPQRAYTSRSKGFWPLELKLMTATRQGKRKLDNIS